MKSKSKFVTEIEKEKKRHCRPIKIQFGLCGLADFHWKNNVPANHIFTVRTLKLNLILTMLYRKVKTQILGHADTLN